MHNLIFITMLLISLACGSKNDSGKQDKNNKTGNDNISSADLKPNQAIIPAPEKMEWAFGRNYKPYTPDKEDIQTAEDVLLQCYNKEITGTYNPFSGRKLEDYNRQFVGGEIEGGDKVIWVNCFCYAEIEYFKKWKTDLIMVADGGNCFFNVKVNLKRKEYYDLMVNGLP